MHPVADVGERIRGRTEVGGDAEPGNQDELPTVGAADDVRVQRHPVDHGDHRLAGQLVPLIAAVE